MATPSLKALIVSANPQWRTLYSRTFMEERCEVLAAATGFNGLEHVQRELFDFILVDESLRDMGPIEFTLNVRDVAPNEPCILVAGDSLERFRRVWNRCGVFLSGTRGEVLGAIPDAIQLHHHARSRQRYPAASKDQTVHRPARR
jgi:CheY-like chemotaxis protein